MPFVHDTDDGLELVYNILKDDAKVKSMATSKKDGLKIRYFDYPETADMTSNWIVLVPLINDRPSNFADKTWVTYDYLLHVDVFSNDREENRELASRIRDLLWDKLGFIQNDSDDQYEGGQYRDARRYKGTLHRSDLDKISKR